MNYYLWENGNQRGPFTMTQLKGMWTIGQITGETLHHNGEKEDWSPLGHMVEDAITFEKNTKPQPVPFIESRLPAPVPSASGSSVGGMLVGTVGFFGGLASCWVGVVVFLAAKSAMQEITGSVFLVGGSILALISIMGIALLAKR